MTSTCIKPQHDPLTMHSLNSSSARRSCKSSTSATVFSGNWHQVVFFMEFGKCRNFSSAEQLRSHRFVFENPAFHVMLTLPLLVVEAHCTETLHQKCWLNQHAWSEKQSKTQASHDELNLPVSAGDSVTCVIDLSTDKFVKVLSLETMLVLEVKLFREEENGSGTTGAEQWLDKYEMSYFLALHRHSHCH